MVPLIPFSKVKKSRLLSVTRLLGSLLESSSFCLCLAHKCVTLLRGVHISQSHRRVLRNHRGIFYKDTHRHAYTCTHIYAYIWQQQYRVEIKIDQQGIRGRGSKVCVA